MFPGGHLPETGPSRAEGAEPSPLQEGRQGGAHAMEAPPCRPLSAGRNSSPGEGCRPLCVSHSAPLALSWTHNSDRALPCVTGQNGGSSISDQLRQGRPETFPGTDVQTRGEANSLALEAVKLEPETPASPPCSPPEWIRIMPRRKWSRTFREDVEPSSTLRTLALGPAQRRLDAWAAQEHVPASSCWGSNH